MSICSNIHSHPRATYEYAGITPHSGCTMLGARPDVIYLVIAFPACSRTQLLMSKVELEVVVYTHLSYDLGLLTTATEADFS